MKMLFLLIMLILACRTITVAQETNSNMFQTAVTNQAAADKELQALKDKITENERRLKRLELEQKRLEQKEAREAMEKKDAAGIPRFSTPTPAPNADGNTRTGTNRWISSPPKNK